MAITKENASNVAVLKRVDANGVAFWGDLGTEVSSDPRQPLPDSLHSVGLIHSDGIAQAENQEEGDAVEAFGKVVVESGTSTRNPTIKLRILETEKVDALLMAYNKAEITGSDSNVKITDKGMTPGSKVLVLQFARKDGKIDRVVYNNCEFSVRGDKEITDDEADSIEVTYNVRPDSDGIYSTRQILKPVVSGV